MKQLLCIISAIFLFCEINAQSIDIDPQNEKTLSLNVPVQTFFKNNEYKRKIAYGYTLGGFRLIPHLEYQPFTNLSFSLGINFLRYWGANEYGQYNFINVPYYSDTNTQKQLHWKPFFRANWQINKKLNFVMGNIHTEHSHFLHVPLYNRELLYSSDGEEGIQLIYNGESWRNDLWLNWQNFNFYNDVDRESFDLGISGSLNITGVCNGYSPDDKYSLDADYSFIWHHNGGELDTISTLDLDHWSNGHIGITFSIYKLFHRFDNLTFSCDYLFSKDMKNSTLPFKSGHAWFPSVKYNAKNWNVAIGYYDSKDMITFYGTNFFSNLAQRDKTVTYPHNQMLYGSIEYNISLNGRHEIYNPTYNLAIVGEFFYKLDDKNSIETETKGLSFGLGVVLTAKPKFQMYKFKNLD